MLKTDGRQTWEAMVGFTMDRILTVEAMRRSVQSLTVGNSVPDRSTDSRGAQPKRKVVSVTPGTVCARAGCSKPVEVKPSGYVHRFCSKEHFDDVKRDKNREKRSVPTVPVLMVAAATPAPAPAAPAKGATGYVGAAKGAQPKDKGLCITTGCNNPRAAKPAGGFFAACGPCAQQKPACASCGGRGHTKDRCRMCLRCKQWDKACACKDGNKAVAAGTSTGSSRKCFQCGGIGHLSKDCTKPVAGAQLLAMETQLQALTAALTARPQGGTWHPSYTSPGSAGMQQLQMNLHQGNVLSRLAALEAASDRK